MTVEDKNILLANGATSAALANGAGISIAGANANLTYLQATDSFDLNKNFINHNHYNLSNNSLNLYQNKNKCKRHNESMNPKF